MENEEFDLSTTTGMREAMSHSLRQLAEIAAARKDGTGNDEKLAQGLAEIRQAQAELRGEMRQLALTKQASGHDSNVSRYIVPSSHVGRETPAIEAGEGKHLMLRGATVRNSDGDEVYLPGLLDDTPCFEQQEGLQRALDDYSLMRVLRTRSNGRQRACPQARAAVLREIRALPSNVSGLVERAFVDVTGKGGDWIETQQLTTLEREEYRISNVEALFGEIRINTNDARMPYSGFGAVPYIKGRAAGDNPPNYKTSDPNTGKRTLSVESLAVHLQVDEDAAEDAWFAVMPLLRQDINDGLADGGLDATINGNTDSTHGDALPGWTAEDRWPTGIAGLADDHRRAYIGLRHRARDVSGAAYDTGAAIDYAGILAMRAKIARPYKTRSGAIVMLVNDMDYIKNILDLDEVKTVDKYGAGASVLTGEVARIAGMPIIPVSFITGDLASTGLYTGSGSTTTRIVCAPSMIKRVVRKNRTVEVAREIRNGTTSIVATERKGMHYMGGANKATVIAGYNVAI